MKLSGARQFPDRIGTLNYPELKTLRERWNDPAEPNANAIKSEVRRFFEATLLSNELAT